MCVLLNLIFVCNSYAVDCEKVMLEKFPESSRCKNITNLNDKKNCFNGVVESSFKKCFEIKDTGPKGLRSSCMVKEMKEIVGKVPPECSNQNKKEILTHLSQAEKDGPGGKSTFENNDAVSKEHERRGYKWVNGKLIAPKVEVKP